jgi:hypothetical protein
MEPICLQGRRFTSADLATVRALIDQHPEWHRSALSQALCQRWHWRNDAGQLKDIAARALLRKLHAKGWIQLPPAQRRPAQPPRPRPPRPAPDQRELFATTPAPIDGPLAPLQPLRWTLAHNPGPRRRVRQLLAQYHYRGFHGPVGENVQYLIHDAQGREIAAMVFGAAAWQVAVRDQFIGWSPAQRQARLPLVTNQQRFLILPWVRVPHLASHLLAQATRRLAADWQARYGHRVCLVETFVETDRFAGTAYRAAGWQCLGTTTGRTRQDRHHTLQTPVKSVWVQPLHRAFAQHLCAAP